MSIAIFTADALRLPIADQSVDLVLGSPPYCDARSYGIGFNLKAADWIDWMMAATREASRVCRGLVVWVCAGVTRDHCYQPAPEGLLYRWWEQGGHCWPPCFWHRHGIPGSGGKQGLKRTVEYCLCFKPPGPLPWADNLAFGHKPKLAPGGNTSNRKKDGRRINEKDPKTIEMERLKAGGMSQRQAAKKAGVQMLTATNGMAEGDTIAKSLYVPPKLANPGNLLRFPVGGGVMGHDLAHENEAPFPERLADFFVRSYCPEGGTVLDPFCGSGTTLAAAAKARRNSIGCDIRESQVALSARRCQDMPIEMF